jgi:hypothetical protein
MDVIETYKASAPETAEIKTFVMKRGKEVLKG